VASDRYAWAPVAVPVLRFGIDPRTPSTLAEGQWEAHVTETGATRSSTIRKLLLDFETLDTRFSLAYGVLDELELELEYENRSGFGGIMDRFINAFHRTWLTDAGRSNFPRNQFQIQIPTTRRPAVQLGSVDKGPSRTLADHRAAQRDVRNEYLPASPTP